MGNSISSDFHDEDSKDSDETEYKMSELIAMHEMQNDGLDNDFDEVSGVLLGGGEFG